MKIYSKLRFNYPVEAVYVFSDTYTLSKLTDFEPYIEDGTLSLTIHNRFFLEFPSGGAYCQVGDDNHLRAVFFSRKGKAVHKINLTKILKQPIASITRTDTDLIAVLIDACFLISQISTKVASGVEGELSADRPEIWTRRGDSLIYSRLAASEVRQHCIDVMEAIIHRRDHAVRGHWRTYPSGKKVWIASHRRGDPELGTVTPVRHLKG